ncbi:Pyruvate/Phosphoenolpyruvate kinase-like domain superfamily [Arabidopsis thaliana x Arabidopsis arenosa]|uniref:Pyruvate/Phosphoenolpyruvate kinase-like domain superfamily n=1 Tax=Arabidopsis thaliana x Arabidopsis arenosa TaxID=1240361 RepID=A0A8T2ABX5_9BRAS|nr:Pyruvate/Phosphoenolpyruvate kinase-like domain superfamily [Arabidopsis thaliana x Arabidopsis arenosa]
MAALSFCSSSPPRILHKQSKSSFFPSDSSSFTQTVGESSAKPISVSRRFRVAINSTAVSDESGNAKLPSSPAKKLREILQSPGFLQGPCCFDALSAKLIERAAFPYCITSGFSISAARLGLPDKGLISYGEMIDQGQQITQSVSIPVIGDGGNGFGNAMNVKRTVKGYIKAGFAGIIINDQVCCEDTKSERRVVSREEAVMRIKAAVDARRECGSDIVIVAQTDSREAISLEESLIRARAFTDAGADVLSVDSLVSREEMKAFCNVYPLVPKLANMLESGGKVPILNPLELEEIGYKLVAYPISLIGVSIQAMQDALLAIKGGRIPPPGSMASVEEIEEILGFDTYQEEEKRYATSSSDREASSSSVYGKRVAQDDPEQREDPIVEVVTPEVYNEPRNPFSRIWSRSLRIKIIGRDGFEKLDVRIPAGFLEGVTNIVPALGGVNLKQLMDDAADEVGGKLLLDFKDTAGDRIQVFLE